MASQRAALNERTPAANSSTNVGALIRMNAFMCSQVARTCSLICTSRIVARKWFQPVMLAKVFVEVGRPASAISAALYLAAVGSFPSVCALMICEITMA